MEKGNLTFVDASHTQDQAVHFPFPQTMLAAVVKREQVEKASRCTNTSIVLLPKSHPLVASVCVTVPAGWLYINTTLHKLTVQYT